MSYFSIIKLFKEKSLNYTATSRTQVTSGSNIYNVFNLDNAYFHSLNSPSEQWWQVQFECSVNIHSYLINTYISLTGVRPTKWLINISNNGNDWRTIQETGRDIGDNDKPFILDSDVRCMFFRIVLKENTYKSDDAYKNYLVLSYFDCFGTIQSKVDRLHSCLNRVRNYRVSYNVIILMMHSQMNIIC